MDSAKKIEREDEPTQVTKLLDELREERERTRTSLVALSACANGVNRRLRRRDSDRAIKALSDKPPAADAE